MAFDFSQGTPINPNLQPQATGGVSGGQQPAVQPAQQTGGFDFNSGTQVTAPQAPVPENDTGTNFVNPADAAMFAKKQDLYNRFNANSASSDWVQQLGTGVGRAESNLVVGTRQLGAKITNKLGLEHNLDPNSPDYNPLLDTKSATANLYKQQMATGQTGAEKVGKTAFDVGSFFVPGAGEEALAAKGLTRAADVAGILGGSDVALAKYTAPIAKAVGLTDEAGKLTKAGSILNNVLANTISGTAQNSIRAGDTNVGDIAKTALLLGAGNAVLGKVVAATKDTTTNLLNQMKDKPWVFDNALKSFKGLMDRTIGSTFNADVTKTLGKLGMNEGDYRNAQEALFFSGANPTVKGGGWDVSAAKTRLGEVLGKYGSDLEHLKSILPGEMDESAIMGRLNGKIYGAGSSDAGKAFDAAKGYKYIPQFMNEVQDTMQHITGGAKPTMSDWYALRDALNKPLYREGTTELLDASDPKVILHKAFVDSIRESVRNKAISELGPEEGKAFSDAFEGANKMYSSAKKANQLLDALASKGAPGRFSRFAAHAVGLLGGLGTSLSG